MATIREYTIKVNPVLGLVDAPKKMYFYRSDVETSSLKILSTAELPNATVSLTCIKKSTNSIVTMTGTVDPLNNVSFTLLLLSQFTSTSDTLNCELKITQDGKKVTTFPNFNIIVNPSIVDGIEGGQDPVEETTLSNLIDEVNDILNKINGGGVDGRGITSITKTGTDGLVDTYTILYTDNTTSTFTVTNGKNGTDGVGIQSVSKTSTEGLVDTYTITLTNGTNTTFTVTNGKDGRGITDISKTSTAGLVDTYTITYTDNTTSTFTVTNGADGGGGGGTGTDGRGIVSITKTDTEGLVDTYTITYTDNTTSTFSVTNGKDGQKGADGRGITSITKTGTAGLVDTYTINYTDNTTSEFSVTNGKDGADGGGGGGNANVPVFAKGYYDLKNDFEDTTKYTVRMSSKLSDQINQTGYPEGDTNKRTVANIDFQHAQNIHAWEQTKRQYVVVFGLYNNQANNDAVTGGTSKARSLWMKLYYNAIKQNEDGSYYYVNKNATHGMGYIEMPILPPQKVCDKNSYYDFVICFDNTDSQITITGYPLVNARRRAGASILYSQTQEVVSFGGANVLTSNRTFPSSSFVGAQICQIEFFYYDENETAQMNATQGSGTNQDTKGIRLYDEGVTTKE